MIRQTPFQRLRSHAILWVIALIFTAPFVWLVSTSLKSLAQACLADPHLFRPFGSIEEAIARLRAIPGIGEWTAQYIALRAARDPDAFPASDLGLQRGAALRLGERPSAKVLLRHAERWRPFRAYAAEHLWAADAAGEQKAP